jgi:hypothetical protein
MEQSTAKAIREVCRARSTERRPFERNPALRAPIGKEQIHRPPLPPDYVVGFVDGEGSFSVSINRHRTMQRGVEIKPEFEIELRADDRDILERILVTIGCGRIFDCSYDRYGWYPHVKYKVTSTRDMVEHLFPFFDRHPPQAKKAEVYRLFRTIVLMVRKKEHLSDEGFQQICALRDRMRSLGKKPKATDTVETARVRENRSPGGVKQPIE